MTDMADDAITALAEDIATILDSITGLKKKHQYIYTTEQISKAQQKYGLPVVLYAYGGMRQSSKHWEIFFDVFLIASAETLTQIKSNQQMPLATELLQRIRKGLACNKPRSNRSWELQSETPDFSVDDKLLYRQRWMTTYQIIR